jgi:subtilisin family serine protease
MAAAAAFLSFALAAGPAFAAGPHAARLSADLADHLQHNSQAIRVIVDGDQAQIDVLAARYNLTIARRLKSGAVFLVNAGQLGALRQDETVDHLSGDIRIRSLFDASAAESIGADQVWAGAGELRPLSGNGVSVAVIDSGIDTRHNALRGRVIATKDFTGGDGMDRYGHGTHVAGIIAGQVGQTADTREFRGIASGASLLN